MMDRKNVHTVLSKCVKMTKLTSVAFREVFEKIFGAGRSFAICKPDKLEAYVLQHFKSTDFFEIRVRFLRP